MAAQKKNMLTVDHYLQLAQDTGNANAYGLNPYALSDYADWLKGRYHIGDSYFKDLGFSDFDVHLVVAFRVMNRNVDTTNRFP